jgi:hypothetical protein
MASFRLALAVALLLILAFDGSRLLGGVDGWRLRAQSPFDLTGSWTLDRQVSQFPQEVGFSASLVGDPAAGQGNDRGGRPNGGAGNPGTGRAPRLQNQSAEDAQRVRYLTDEVRLPYDRLVIAVTPAVVTIAPDRASLRTVHPGRRDEVVNLGPVTALINAAWEGNRLVIVYKAETGRSLRYTYAIDPAARRLIVDVEFMERGGDKVRRVYQPATGEPATGPNTAASGASGSTAVAPAPPASRFSPASPGLSLPAAGAVDQRPDAILKGLNRLGVVVEGPGAEAAKCGLKIEALETAVGKRLTDAGFRVAVNSDEDSYLYVNINTASSSAALCVSRYDVTLYSHATARLTHTTSPVPLQVELLHEGGLAGGPPAAHADGVSKSVLDDVDRLIARVRDANR